MRIDRSNPHLLRPRRPVDLGLLVIGLAAVGLVAWMGYSFWSATRVRVEVAGLVDRTPFTPDDASRLDIKIRVPGTDDRFRAALDLDGVDLLDRLDFDGDTLRIQPANLVASKLVQGALDEGEHQITLRVGRLFLSDAVFRWRYDVDSVAPMLRVRATFDPVPIDKPVTVRGRVEAGAALRVDGAPLDARDGRFAITFDHPPTAPIRFEATDRAGNQTAAESIVPVAYRASSRGVHVTAAAWASADVRASILALADRDLIDTVVLDLKDERGIVGYTSKVPMAVRIGATRARFDLADAVRTVEKHGARVVGRLVAFRDPTFAAWAWAAGRKDEVLQTTSGDLLTSYGGFANYAHPTVRKYNLDLALEAVDLGVRDILWDDVRRPEGSPDTMVVPGLEGSSAAVVARFLSDAHEALRARGAYQGAAVLGIAVASGDAVGQDIPAMARAVDYLAPTIYPARWGPGLYGVARPIREPYEITRRALADFQRVTAGTGVRLLPWIQDFTLNGVPYGPAEVRAQIDAAAFLGIKGFLLWNPNVRYTAAALTPMR